MNPRNVQAFTSAVKLFENLSTVGSPILFEGTNCSGKSFMLEEFRRYLSDRLYIVRTYKTWQYNNYAHRQTLPGDFMGCDIEQASTFVLDFVAQMRKQGDNGTLLIDRGCLTAMTYRLLREGKGVAREVGSVHWNRMIWNLERIAEMEGRVVICIASQQTLSDRWDKHLRLVGDQRTDLDRQIELTRFFIAHAYMLSIVETLPPELSRIVYLVTSEGV